MAFLRFCNRMSVTITVGFGYPLTRIAIPSTPIVNAPTLVGYHLLEAIRVWSMRIDKNDFIY
jgi:xanthosine utilization system XapX-like protein